MTILPYELSVRLSCIIITCSGEHESLLNWEHFLSLPPSRSWPKSSSPQQDLRIVHIAALSYSSGKTTSLIAAWYNTKKIPLQKITLKVALDSKNILLQRSSFWLVLGISNLGIHTFSGILLTFPTLFRRF